LLMCLLKRRHTIRRFAGILKPLLKVAI